MSAPLAKKYWLRVAIDFGTFGTAFCFELEDGTIFFVSKYPDAPADSTYCKNRTKLLYDSTKPDPIAWGYQAKKKYYELLEENPQQANQRYSLYQNFKMGLHQNLEFFPDFKGQSMNPNNRRRTAQLITDYLKKLWSFIKETIQRIADINVDSSDISWCLSMPAIWSPKSKEIMRQCAFDAKMLDSKNPSERHYLCVLEPEAAAIDCMAFMDEMQVGGLVEGKKIIIIDAGGGTIDITNYLVGKDKKLGEIKSRDGNSCGSTRLDAEFERFLKEKFGHDFVEDILKNKTGWVELLDNWEKAKCKLSSDLNTKLRIDCPVSLLEDFTAQCAPIPERNDYYNAMSAKILIPPKELKSFFGPVLDEIVQKIRQFTSIENYDYLFLVGGFADSEVLQARIKSEFQTIPNIIIPKNATQSVIRGCIALGKDPSLIKARRANKTFGVAMLDFFNPQKGHLISKKRIHDGTEYVDDVFELYVQKEEEIPYDKVVSKKFTVAFPEQDSAVVELYSSDQTINMNQTNYITDPIFDLVGCIVVEMTSRVGMHRTATVNLQFGRSELKMEAIDDETGKVCQSAFTYLD